MPTSLSREKLNALREHFVGRQHELLTFVCALVETESPSGDEQGSRDVVEVLANAARSIPAVSSVERTAAESVGEHVCIRAFVKEEEAPQILLLGHTDTVHPRGSTKLRPWRTEANRIYGPGVFDMKANCALALEL